MRARKPAEAARVCREVVASPEGLPEDRVSLADALIRAGDWTKAEDVLDDIPPTHETYDRYRLEAMVADANEELDQGRQLLRDRGGAHHPAGADAQQLGLFEALARRFRGRREAVSRGADL